MTIARLEYYLEFGNSEVFKKTCRSYIAQYDETRKVTDAMMTFADSLTPKVHLITNVEYQTMRKGTKSYNILPVSDNSLKGAARRVYDYLDNRPLIIDYLTRDIFRLVEPSGDGNKSRRDYCGFWKALRATKVVDAKRLPKELKLVRTYNRKLNKDVMKRDLLNKSIVYGIYTKGINDDGIMQDAMNALLKMNDNDIMNALRYKRKKSREFSAAELSGMLEQTVSHDFVLVDRLSGAVYDDSISLLDLQYGGTKDGA